MSQRTISASATTRVDAREEEEEEVINHMSSLEQAAEAGQTRERDGQEEDARDAAGGDDYTAVDEQESNGRSRTRGLRSDASAPRTAVSKNVGRADADSEARALLERTNPIERSQEQKYERKTNYEARQRVSFDTMDREWERVQHARFAHDDDDDIRRTRAGTRLSFGLHARQQPSFPTPYTVGGQRMTFHGDAIPFPKLHGMFVNSLAAVEEWVNNLNDVLEARGLDGYDLDKRMFFNTTDSDSVFGFDTLCRSKTWEERFEEIMKNREAKKPPKTMMDEQGVIEIVRKIGRMFTHGLLPVGAQGYALSLLACVAGFDEAMRRNADVSALYTKGNERKHSWASREAWTVMIEQFPDVLRAEYRQSEPGYSPDQTVPALREWLKKAVGYDGAKVDALVKGSLFRASMVGEESRRSAKIVNPLEKKTPAQKQSLVQAEAGNKPSFRDKPPAKPAVTQKQSTSHQTSGKHIVEKQQQQVVSQHVLEECREFARDRLLCIACGGSYHPDHRYVCKADKEHQLARQIIMKEKLKRMAESASGDSAASSSAVGGKVMVTQNASVPTEPMLNLPLRKVVLWSNDNKVQTDAEILCDTACTFSSSFAKFEGFCDEKVYEQFVKQGVAEMPLPEKPFVVEAGDGTALNWTVIGRGTLRVLAKALDSPAAEASLTLAIVCTDPKSRLRYPIVGNKWLEDNCWGLRIADMSPKSHTELLASKPRNPHLITDESVDTGAVQDANQLGDVLRKGAEAATMGGEETVPLYLDGDSSPFSKAEEEHAYPVLQTPMQQSLTEEQLAQQRKAQEERDDKIAAAVHFLPAECKAVVASRIRFLDKAPWAADALGALPARGFVATEKLDPSRPWPTKRFMGGRVTEEQRPMVLDLLTNKDLFAEIPAKQLKNPQLAYRIAASVSVVHSAGKPRVVSNFIASNSVTVDQGTWCDPIEQQFQDLLREGDYFNVLDLTKAFFQIELNDPDQLSLVLFEGRYFQSKRLGTGAKNSMMFLHLATNVWFAGLLDTTWHKYADNFQSAAFTSHDAVEKWAKFDQRCEEFNVTYNLKGLLIGAPRVTLLGFELGNLGGNLKGYRKGQKAMANVVQVKGVETFADVARLSHLGRYAGSQVLRIHTTLEPLRVLLANKSPALKDLARIPVSEEERAVAERARVELVEVLGNQLVINVYRSEWRTVAFCDSCDRHWGSLVVQYPPSEEELELFERTYTVIAVYHGSWNKRELAYHINEKELECVKATVDAIHPLIRGGLGPLVVYSDNSTSVQRAVNVVFSEQKKARVMRALLLIKNARVELRHLAGALNQVADLLSRRQAEELLLVESIVVPVEPKVAPATTMVTSTRAQAAQMQPTARTMAHRFGTRLALERNLALASQPHPRAIWQNANPCEELTENIVLRIKAASNEGKPEKPDDKWVDGAFMREVNHVQVWVIPREEEGVQRAVWAICHCVGGTHPGVDPTVALMQRFVVFEGMRDKVAVWNCECMICTMCNPVKQRVQLGTNRQAFGPFDMLALDFCDAGSTTAEGFKYLLVLCDVFSLHLRAVPVTSMTATEAAKQVVKYSNDYLPPTALFSDQGSGFVSEVMKYVAKRVGFNQFLTLPDMAFSRGVIEASVGCVKQTILKLAVSFKRNMRDFPDLVDIACGLHNNTATTTPSMQGYSPNQIVFGQDRGPCTLLFKRATEAFESVPVPPDVKQYVAEMSRGVAGIHRYLLDARRRNGVDAKLKRGETKNDFQVGDFVLVAVDDRPNLATPRWDTPSVVIQQTTPRSVVVEDLVTKARTEKHVAELRLLGAGRVGLDLNEWEMIFYSAKNKHEIHDITQFKVDEKDRLMAKFEFGRAPAAPMWKPVKEWVTKVPLLFNVLLETELCVEPKIYKALEEILVKAGVRDPVVSAHETVETVEKKVGAKAQEKMFVRDQFPHSI